MVEPDTATSTPAHVARPSAIGRVAVLGAGTMGSQIAAHFANAGVPALLLDLSQTLADEGLRRAQYTKPDPFFTTAAARRVTTGSFDQLARIAEVDWVIEAVVERLDVKQALLERVDHARRPGTLVTSNTSGLPIAALAEGRSDDFRRHWLGTHFFNPPRYLKLVELIPTPETDPAIIDGVAQFIDRVLGKGVVIAKDTPNFIANRIGLFSTLRVLATLDSGDYTLEEIDAITGRILGRSKSGTFRTLDLAGLDVVTAVARNLSERLADGDERRAFHLPPLVQTLVERGWLGEKTGQGFYKRVKGAHGQSEILTLDPKTLEYRPAQPVRLPSLDRARASENVAERVKMLFASGDKVGAFLRSTLAPTLLYSAQVALEIAYSIDDVDRAFRWGFGWELGPFELWDVIGLGEIMNAMPGGSPAPPLIAERLKAGRPLREAPFTPVDPAVALLATAKQRRPALNENVGASVIDLGEGVVAIEFHSKMNAIGPDILEMVQLGLDEASRNFVAVVIGTDAKNFSAGANLLLLLLEAQEGNWDEIDAMVRGFQGLTQALRYAPVPVIVATSGLALGGGCEVALHADRVQAAAESYLGLVEAGVGLIPAGGGTKELLARNMDDLTLIPERGLSGASVEFDGAVRRTFETIGFGRVSTSAPHARELGLLRDSDAITMNRDRLLLDARALALERVREGYRPPLPRRLLVGGEGTSAQLKLGVHLAWRAGRISDHDAVVARTLAFVLAGGSLPHATMVDEPYMLDLEREAFLKLCGEPKTLERIGYTLKTGKTLHN